MMESKNTPLKLTKEVVHQQRQLKEAVSIAVNEDCDECDVFIVSKDNKILTCQRSLLVLYSPLIAHILSSLPCCLSPTIFLPNFQEQHIRRFLHLLGSGQAIAGQNINTDIKSIAKIAEVLQIPMTDINIGTYIDNPLGVPSQIKKEFNNFNVKGEVKEEVHEETESSSEKYEELGQGEYFEDDELENIIRKREEADTARPNDSFASYSNEEDMFELNLEASNQEKKCAVLEEKEGEGQTEKLSVQVIEESDQISYDSGEQFMAEAGLNNLKKIHTGEKSSVHTRSHTGEGRFQCEYCPRKFRSSRKLKIHTSWCHIEDDGEKCCVETEALNKDKTIDGLENKDSREQIEQVIGDVTEKTNVDEEQENGLGFISSVTSLSPNSVSLRSRRGRFFASPTQGPKLNAFRKSNNKNFDQKHTKVKIRNDKTLNRPFPCKICPKRFKSSGHLKEHRRIHTGEKPFPCELCNKTYTTSRQLKVHKRTHTGEKPFRCELCPKRFAQPANLNTHMRFHSGEKPVKCGACPKKFVQASDLNRHTKIHTKPERNISSK